MTCHSSSSSPERAPRSTHAGLGCWHAACGGSRLPRWRPRGAAWPSEQDAHSVRARRLSYAHQRMPPTRGAGGRVARAVYRTQLVSFVRGDSNMPPRAAPQRPHGRRAMQAAECHRRHAANPLRRLPSPERHHTRAPPARRAAATWPSRNACRARPGPRSRHVIG